MSIWPEHNLLQDNSSYELHNACIQIHKATQEEIVDDTK